MIADSINCVLADKGELRQTIGADTVILGSDFAFDSLDLAALVVQMDVATGTSPFADGFIDFRTVGELAVLYSTPRV